MGQTFDCVDAYTQVAESCKQKGAPEVDVITCDLAKLSTIKGFAEGILAKYKDGLDVLVNNAGTLGPLDYGKVWPVLLLKCTCSILWHVLGNIWAG